jgi:hypothetical protein
MWHDTCHYNCCVRYIHIHSITTLNLLYLDLLGYAIKMFTLLVKLILVQVKLR